MRIRRIPLIGGPAQDTRPGVLISFGQGCGVAGCSCSPGNWITVCDGEVILNVRLTDGEVDELLATRPVGSPHHYHHP